MLSPRLCIFAGFILRFAVAIWNGYFGPSIGAEFDAQSFHFLASEIAKDASFTHFQVTWIYPQFLGIFYLLTTDSIFLGSLLSCFIWALSGSILSKSMNLLSIKMADQVKVLLIYAFLPTSILFTAVTLREPYQLLFVNLMIYAALKISFRATILNWVILILACIGAGFLHGGLMICAFFFVLLMIFFKSTNQLKSLSLVKILLYGSISLVSIYYLLLAIGDLTTYSFNSGMIETIENFNDRASSLDSRTNYKTPLSFFGIGDISLFIITSIIGYLFEPFLWHIQNIGDLILAFEGILRGYLIYRVFQTLLIAANPNRNLLLLVFFLYLALTIVFAIGTVNWGTSARHNLLTLGPLLLLSYGSFWGARHSRSFSPEMGSNNYGKNSK